MDFFSVKNWDELQHYKDRAPPWIKLYNHLLDDYEFACLQDASKLHLVLIWLLASRNNNRLPFNARWIKQRIGVDGDVDLNELAALGFIEVEPIKDVALQSAEQDASTTLADCKQVATTEERRVEERESREEGEKEKPKKRFSPPSIYEIKDHVIEKGYGFDPDSFFSYYESNGWMVGKNKMKCWKSACVGWNSREKKNGKSSGFNQQDDRPRSPGDRLRAAIAEENRNGSTLGADA